MNLTAIKYQSFCWKIGTTSFRTAKLNLKIEEQLLLLDEFYQKVIERDVHWVWNPALQEEYYNFMRTKGFLAGEAERKDKDARQKSSGLVNIGLLTQDHRLNPVGKALLKMTQNHSFDSDNPLNLDKDSYLYFKQLLKTTIYVGKNITRPYFILAYLLAELDFLSDDEFCYLLPLCISKETTEDIVNLIRYSRESKNKISVEDMIYDRLSQMENYQAAYQLLMQSREVTEDIILKIGFNRKSAKGEKSYDKPYYELYLSLYYYFLKNKGSEIELLETVKNIKQKTKWISLIFNTSTTSSIKKLGKEYINTACPFLKCKTEKDLKDIFFKYLHTFKAMATLKDYSDLNRRYFSLSDTLIFSDGKVVFDIIPSYFFKSCYKNIFSSAFSACDKLSENIELTDIDSHLIFDKEAIYTQICQDYQVNITDSKQVAELMKSLRLQRFNRLIDKKFNKNVLLDLLTYFENREDKKINSIVTEEANIPTIFEYILAIIWYEISERKGNILDYMKLSLSADLLPKTHAGGGYADIIYEYEETEYYPKHSVLVEATLAESTNQRRMEMEPVSRHLGEYRLKYQNPFDYSLFISTFLHINVISDFRGRKYIPYYGRENEYIESLKIIPFDTQRLSKLLKNNTKYYELYSVFERHYQSELPPKEWYENMLSELE